jgi:TolB-like protein/tetratricopeptide (TPR) repeat protein
MIKREAILAELKKIESSALFRNSEMLKRFLHFVVLETLDYPERTLKQYTIAVEALGRPGSFDPTLDPIVRIQAGRLRRNLKQYYAQDGAQNMVVISLPVGSYVPIFKLNSTEVTNSSLPAEQLNEDVKYTIAVEPLKDFRNTTDNDFLAEGFTQEMLVEISLYKHLQIIRIGHDLNPSAKRNVARFIVSGSLTSSGNLHKLALTLTDNSSAQILWSTKEKFNFPTGDIITIQEDIATQVAQQIAGLNGIVCERLHGETNWEETSSPRAYATFMHFYRYHNNPNERTANELLPKVAELVHLEPNFGPGWSVLCNLYNDAYIFSLDEAYREEALKCGANGFELQPNNQACILYYAYALLVSNKLDEAESLFSKVLNLNRNALFYTGSIGWLYCLAGDFKNGFPLIKESMELESHFPKWFYLATFLFYMNREEYGAALEEAKKLEKPDLFWSPMIQMVGYYYVNDLRMAMKKYKEITELKPNFFEHAEQYIACLVKSNHVLAKMVAATEELKSMALSQSQHS